MSAMATSDKSEKRSLFEEEGKKPDGILKINQEYASNYQIRKERQEYLEKQPSDDSSSDDEPEDEDGNLLVTPTMDVSIVKTINALRNKDESIYDGTTRFFPEPTSTDDDDDQEEEERQHKPKHFKDVIREQILEQIHQEESASKQLQQQNLQDKMTKLEYDLEQKELRSAFLDSTNESDQDDEDWMVKKQTLPPPQTKVNQLADQMLQDEFKVMEQVYSKNSEKDVFVDPRGEIENGQEFLFDFLKNKKWIDKTLVENQEDNDIDDDDSMEELEKADDFESKYNFRFEESQEPSSGAQYSMVSYARGNTVNTLRRPDDSRRLRRLQHKERKAAQRQAKEEELRRLKNAKRHEMELKYKQIQNVIGTEKMDQEAMMKLLEGDYDAEQFEQVMNETYNEDYYQQQDEEWKTDANVRTSLKRNDVTDDVVVDQYDNEDGDMYDNNEDEGDYKEETEEQQEEHVNDYNDQDDDLFNQQDEAETETEKKLKQKMMDELYKLDYEDIVAGMPTRFKYKSVEPNDYGLSTQEILFSRDATLKQYVSLKKLAPYRQEGEHHVTGKRRRRFRDLLKHDMEEEMEKEEAQHALDESNAPQPEEEEPKKKKRRRQKKGKKKESKDVNDEARNDDGVTSAPPQKEEAGEVENGNVETKKRKRKKKGVKKQQHQSTEEETENQQVEKQQSARTVEENELVAKEPMLDNTSDRQDEHIANGRGKDKKKKHKKKKKKPKVQGVSSSRLASYGLQ